MIKRGFQIFELVLLSILLIFFATPFIGTSVYDGLPDSTVFAFVALAGAYQVLAILLLALTLVALISKSIVVCMPLGYNGKIGTIFSRISVMTVLFAFVILVCLMIHMDVDGILGGGSDYLSLGYGAWMLLTFFLVMILFSFIVGVVGLLCRKK